MMPIMDIEFLDRPWTRGKLHALIFGVSVLDDVAGDGLRDLPVSWLMLRSYALDAGRPEVLHDCIQLESMVGRIRDPVARSAVLMKMLGFTMSEIGGLLGSRVEQRTGRRMVLDGLEELYAMIPDNGIRIELHVDDD